MRNFITLLFLVASLLASGQNTFPSSGNVGIGTTSPTYALSIYSPTQNVLSIKSPSHAIVNIESGAGLNSYLQFTNNGVLRWDLTGETTGNLRVYDYVAGLTRFAITPSGNVGIGTSSPQEKLHVNGNVYVGTNQLQFLSASGGNNRIQSFGGTSVGTWQFKSRFDNIVLDAGESVGNERKILFKTAGSDRMIVDSYGNVGIGTTNPDAKLAVKGTVHANEVKVDLNVPIPDYVFADNYQLQPLNELKTYIDQNKHLPEVPSAAAMEANGINLGEMNMLLLKKVEELTLYVIELKREMTDLKNSNLKK